MKRYEFHPGAEADLNSIWNYLAGKNQSAADRLITELYRAIEMLAQFPDAGRRRWELSSRELRFWTIGEYSIAYLPDRKPLFILSVLHGRRNPRWIATLLRRRTI